MKHGSTYRFPSWLPSDVGCPDSLRVSWTYQGDYLNPSSLCTWWTSCNSGLFVDAVAVAVPEYLAV